MEKINFGVNYVPSNQWFYSWVDWDAKKVEEDLAAIHEMGFDHIRAHLRWDLFQQFENFVSPIMIERLIQLLDIANKNQLKVEITALNGWMSGVWFLPSFSIGKHIIADANIVKAEKYYLLELINAVKNHPALMGIDLGNEINVFGYFIKDFSIKEGDAWLSEMFNLLEENLKDKINVLGVDHVPWFCNQYFSRKALANTGDVTSLHTWTKFTGAVDKFGALSDQSLYLIDYMIELANAYAKDTKRKVWVQEFGISPEWTNPENFEEFITKSITNSISNSNLWGYTWWCSHDIDRKYNGFAGLEYDLGLLDINNRIKPTGTIMKNIIKKYKNEEIQHKKDKTAIVISDNYFNGKEDGIGFSLANEYIKLKKNGEEPCFVLDEYAGNQDYLNKREIKKVIY